MQTARQAVTALKKQYSLRQLSAKSLSDAIEKQGYTVIPFLAVGNEGDVAALIHALGLQAFVKTQKGFTYESDKYRLVFINEDLSEQEQLFVLAHELGHICCGHSSTANVIGKDVQQEHEANEFAHYLLYPSSWERFKQLLKRRQRAVAVLCVALVGVAVLVAVLLAVNREQTYYGNYYVTSTGNKYHVQSCKFVKNKTNIRRLTKDDIASGKYTACEMCLPQE